MIKRITLIFLLTFNFSWAQLSFQESATANGVGVSYGVSTYGGGVSFCDFDGDGWDDITYSTTDGEEVYFYKNNNGTFTLIDLGINDTYRTKQVIWIDYDSDGDKDFFATSISGLNKFYENDGSMNFTDITATCGLFTDNKYTYGASFGDIDNDGDLDVFICNRDDVTFNQYNYLYRNDSGTYVEITSSAGINLGNQVSFTSAFFDYNNDGYQDIYVANDKIANINRLYENDGDGTFTDVSLTSGAGIAIDAMSTTIGDYNNDGWFDIYVTNTTGGNQLLNNNGDGTFTNVAPFIGVAFESIAWGAVFLDADNDSNLDLYVSGIFDGSVPSLLPSAFYENQGDDTFSIPSGIGFSGDVLTSFSNAIGDFNNDGLPDIIVMNDTDNNFLWENTTTNSNNWLKLKLQGVTSNKDGIGSKIEISAGGKTQYRYTLNGEGYIGQNSNTEFIGLGTETTIDYLKITWLSGTVDYFTNVSVNQSLTVQEGESLSVDEFNDISIQVFPNPVKNQLNIQLKNANSENSIVELYDLLGKRVIVKSADSSIIKIDVSNFSSGLYFLKCLVDNKTITRKIVLD
ncbi:MAG: FG-GAP-like repeat-containing protein [Urechidicola sp.]|nr:FG-GAP-like repeat-containing protein [Urechidicola sp.]